LTGLEGSTTSTSTEGTTTGGNSAFGGASIFISFAGRSCIYAISDYEDKASYRHEPDNREHHNYRQKDRKNKDNRKTANDFRKCKNHLAFPPYN
jgi:hypothetical protein